MACWCQWLINQRQYSKALQSWWLTIKVINRLRLGIQLHKIILLVYRNTGLRLFRIAAYAQKRQPGKIIWFARKAKTRDIVVCHLQGTAIANNWSRDSIRTSANESNCVRLLPVLALDFDMQVHYPLLPAQSGSLPSYLCINRAAGFYWKHYRNCPVASSALGCPDEHPSLS